MLGNDDKLRRKIRLGEDAILELKDVAFKGTRVAGPDRRGLADELAAFANSRGGLLVLGVDDRSREVRGLPPERLDTVETWVRQIVNDSIEPPLLAHIIRTELPDASGALRPVITVEVPRSLFVHKSPGGYLHRLGSSKRELSPEMLARLFQQRSQARIIRFEEQAVPDTGFDDLSERLWKRFLGSHLADPVTTLRKMKILTHDDDGVERATVAGVLLCSDRPERWLPGATIEGASYRGTRQSDPQIDAAHICASLDEQIRQATVFVRRNMRVAAIKDPARLDVAQFSERAVFEAVVNAVAHRDYSIHGSKIRIFLFEDRLEIFSPGALANSLAVESLALRQATRNELVTSLLGRCELEIEETQRVGRRFLMEKRGDGVPIIFDESRELSGREPVYRLIDEAELQLTIWSAELPHR